MCVVDEEEKEMLGARCLVILQRMRIKREISKIWREERADRAVMVLVGWQL